MKQLWNKRQEKDFFTQALKTATPQKLFYQTIDNSFYAYWHKHYKGVKNVLQSRNALIGEYTEEYSKNLFQAIAEKLNGYAVRGVICEELALTKRSPADLCICKTDRNEQSPENILMIIEVKMSIVWNWQLIHRDDGKYVLKNMGDYKSHQGNPGLLRSDSMLKAIGKSINIRTASSKASKIPIIILGNTPITGSYHQKVDQLKRKGLIQGCWSINPNLNPNNIENIKKTNYNGFYRLDSYRELEHYTFSLLEEDQEFFLGMLFKKDLGKIIEKANEEKTYENKATRFLQLLKE